MGRFWVADFGRKISRTDLVDTREIACLDAAGRENRMQLLRLSFRNARRSPARALMTILAVAISLLAFVLLRAVSAGWTEQVKQTPDNRVITRHKMGWGRSLPVNYAQLIRELPGVKTALGASWGGLINPSDPRQNVEGMALEAVPFIAMHHELDAPREQQEAFISDRQGAYASRELAQQFGWKLGDRLRFRSLAFEAELELNLSGIYTSKRHGFSQRSLYFHWEYFNERLPEPLRDRINMVAAEVEDPHQGARIAQAIDMKFGERDDQTFSQEDQATMAQLVGRFGAVLEGLDLVSLLILGVVMLILGNTVAMSVRERTREYGALRAIGFRPSFIIGFVLAEAATLGILGGFSCLLLAYPLIEKGLGRYLEEAVSFPPIHVSIESALVTLMLGGLLGSLAAALPAIKVARRNIVDSLRSVG
jgi:putative ABC transport system permease protein